MHVELQKPIDFIGISCAEVCDLLEWQIDFLWMSVTEANEGRMKRLRTRILKSDLQLNNLLTQSFAQ